MLFRKEDNQAKHRLEKDLKIAIPCIAGISENIKESFVSLCVFLILSYPAFKATVDKNKWAISIFLQL